VFTVAVAATVVVLCIDGLWLLSLPSRSALYNGHRLQYWNEAMLAKDAPTRRSASRVLMGVLNDKNEDLRNRLQAVVNLARADPDDEEVVLALCAALKDSEPRVRLTAAASLGRMGPKNTGVVPSLMDALEDEDVDLRIEAVTALQLIGSPAAVEALRSAARNNNEPRVREEATRALKVLGLLPSPE
jgi:HEAT repeat protein